MTSFAADNNSNSLGGIRTSVLVFAMSGGNQGAIPANGGALWRSSVPICAAASRLPNCSTLRPTPAFETTECRRSHPRPAFTARTPRCSQALATASFVTGPTKLKVIREFVLACVLVESGRTLAEYLWSQTAAAGR